MPPESLSGSALLCISPPNLGLSFQEGFLGVKPASVAGEVQLKLLPQDGVKPSISKVEILLTGIERSLTESEEWQEIELHRQKRLLWSAEDLSTSDRLHEIPSTLPFSLELTSDLPHCVHSAPLSSLEYSLTATVYFAHQDQLPVSYKTPVHVTRYSPESSACCSDAHKITHSSDTCLNGPAVMLLEHPASISMSLQKTAFHRTEPIPVRVQIEPPQDSLVEKGVSLRSVSLELVRTTASLLLGKAYHSTVSRSGKSARFSPTRSLNLYLAIPPRCEQNLPCESITQSTILHTVSFSLRLTISVTSRDLSDRQDIIMEKPIVIMPDLPISFSRKSEKRKEAEAYEQTWDHRGAAPTYVESVAGSSSAATLADPFLQAQRWNDEVEYDGFEQSVSAEADAMFNAAPPIEEDVSPPALSPNVPLVFDENTLRPFLLEAGYIHIPDNQESPQMDGQATYDLYPISSRTSMEEESSQSTSTLPSSRCSSLPPAGQAIDDPPSYTQDTRAFVATHAVPPPYQAHGAA